MAARQLARLLRQGEDERDVGDWQEQGLLLLKPYWPGHLLALRTVSVRHE